VGKSTEEIRRIYDAVSSPEGMSFHIAHGRRENSGVEYNSEAIVAAAPDRAVKDVAAFRKAMQIFRARSVPRE
jgi:hypothetical protein